MKKFGRKTIQAIVDRAIEEFVNDESAPDLVEFLYNGHYVSATIDWSNARSCFYVYDFLVVYSRCVMRYKVREDFDLSSAMISLTDKI